MSVAFSPDELHQVKTAVLAEQREHTKLATHMQPLIFKEENPVAACGNVSYESGNINYIQHMNAFWKYAANDTRLKPNHISLYMALFMTWNNYRFRQRFPIKREKIMQTSKIGSANTYSHCLKWLHKCGYIIYRPSGRPYILCTISIVLLAEGFAKHAAYTPVMEEREGDMDSRAESDRCAATESDRRVATESDRCAGIENDFGMNCKTGMYAGVESDIGINRKTGTCAGIENDIDTHLKTNTHAGIESDTATVANLRHNYLNKNIITKTGGKQAPAEKKDFIKNKNEKPTIAAVLDWFARREETPQEARRFFYHYEAINWTLSGQPIIDWEAAAAKWAENIKPGKNIKSEKTNTHVTRSYSDPL